MKMKKWLAAAAAACLAVSLAGCSGGSAVYVQSVEALGNIGGIAPGDRFGGIVVSENVTEIEKDKDMSIDELFVKEGDDVTVGQELFSYDMDELQLTLDKQNLELDQLNASIENYKSQIATLEKERKSAGSSAKLQYTIEIQSMQLDLQADPHAPATPLPLGMKVGRHGLQAYLQRVHAQGVAHVMFNLVDNGRPVQAVLEEIASVGL